MKITYNHYKSEYRYCVWLEDQFPDFEYGSIFIKDKWDEKIQGHVRIYSVMGWGEKITRKDHPLLDTILDGIDQLIPMPTH